VVREPAEGDVHFPSTHWTEIRTLARALAGGDRAALEPLIRRYQAPLAAHLVRERHIDPHRADDLLQGFFLARFLTGDLLARADRHRGRFRTLVLAALNNYLVSEHRYQAAQKRSPGPPVRGDGHELEGELPGPESPSEVFDRAWARQVLDEVLRRVQEQCRREDRPDLAGILECRLLAERPAPYDELVRRFGYLTPGQVSNAVRRARDLYAGALRQVLSLEARDEGDVEELIGDLLTILGQARA
jgi:RNA polymerase sigma-70 factor (ECF subfamily)